MLFDEICGSGEKLTKQTQEILSGSTILQLLSLVLDQLRSNFTRICSVLPESCHPWTLVPLHHPGHEALRGKPEYIYREYASLRGGCKCTDTMKDVHSDGPCREGRDPHARFVYDLVSLLSAFSNAPK